MERQDIRKTVFEAMEKAAEGQGETPLSALAQGLITLVKAVEEMQESVVYNRSWIGELQRRPSMKYLGVWKEGQEYSQGNFATYAASCWHCERTTKDKPGNSPDWKLAVKGVRDDR